jgi:glucose uptake protein
MILPGSQLLNLILLLVGVFCLGTWANTFKMTSRWRFELYYFDFAFGTVLAAVLIGLTFGSLGWDGFALRDDFGIAAKQKDAMALAAGVIFNLGNMLILSALSIAGLTVACMIGLATMMTSGMVLLQFARPSGNGPMLYAGAVLILGSAALLAFAARLHSIERLVLLAQQGKTKSTKKKVSMKGILLAAGGGIIAGGYFPLVNVAGEGETGVGPYLLGIFFTIGMAISTVVFGVFFMNLPVHGEPLEVGAYFKGKAKFHWLGVLGGILFYIALISLLLMAPAEGKNVVPAFIIRALMLAAALIGAMWGILRWNEFAGAGGKVRTFLLIALFAFVTGVVGISAAAGISTAG